MILETNLSLCITKNFKEQNQNLKYYCLLIAIRYRILLYFLFFRRQAGSNAG